VWGIVRKGRVGRGSGVSTSQLTLGRSPGLAAEPPHLKYGAFRRFPMRGAAPWVAPAQAPALLVASEFAAARLMSAGVREHMVSAGLFFRSPCDLMVASRGSYQSAAQSPDAISFPHSAANDTIPVSSERLAGSRGCVVQPGPAGMNMRWIRLDNRVVIPHALMAVAETLIRSRPPFPRCCEGL
jgi:hypothetical protein